MSYYAAIKKKQMLWYPCYDNMDVSGGQYAKWNKTNTVYSHLEVEKRVVISEDSGWGGIWEMIKM